MTALRFWSSLNLAALLLIPFGLIYGLAAYLRFALTRAKRAGRPVICVGNFTLGGTGKTPAVIYIAERLKIWGEKPFILSRGYGGRFHGPHLVDPAHDSAEDAGDEALLLAQTAPTVIGGNRLASAELALAQGASVLVLDDGMQNPQLEKDLTLALVDGQLGLGNELVFPAGPLRGFLSWQEKLADIVFTVGKDARLEPENAEWLKGTRVLAFCGIGNPEKFRATLLALGADIVRLETYPDHYAYDAQDANELIAYAVEKNLTLVTTEKDHVRLRGSPDTRAQLAGLANIVAVKFVPDDAAKFDALLKRVLSPANAA